LKVFEVFRNLECETRVHRNAWWSVLFQIPTSTCGTDSTPPFVLFIIRTTLVGVCLALEVVQIAQDKEILVWKTGIDWHAETEPGSDFFPSDITSQYDKYMLNILHATSISHEPSLYLKLYIAQKCSPIVLVQGWLIALIAGRRHPQTALGTSIF